MRLTPFVLLLALIPGVAAQGDALPSVEFEHEPARILVGQAVQFRSLAQDPEGNITNWTWDLGTGDLAYGETIEYTFHERGEYLVQLTVTDGAGNRVTWGDPIRARDPGAEGVLAYLPTWLFWAMPLLVSAILFMLAYVVLNRGQPAIYNLVFFFLYLASGLKSVTESFAILTQGLDGPHRIIIEANESISYLYVPLFLWFVLVFPRPVRPWLIEGRRGAVTLLLAVPFLINQVTGWIPFEAVLNYFNTFVSLIALTCLGLLVYHAWETDSYEERARIRFLAVTFAILVVSNIVIALLNLTYTYQTAVGSFDAADSTLRATAVFSLILVPLLEIVGAMLMMYAILRFQLMGIQSLVVKITRGAAVALMVPATFIIVGNVIEEIFQNIVLSDQNIRFDFIIAGFVSAFAMAPIQKFTTYLLNKVLPALSATDEALRRLQIYETQVRYSLLDGALNEKEIRVLQKLALELKLSAPEVRQVAATFPSANLAPLTAATGAANAA